MILRWWRNWREQRAVLAEMEQLRLADEAVLMDQSNNPLHLAKLSSTSGELKETATQWELARSLVPNAVLTSEDSLDVLLVLKRYDEAEQLMRQRLERRRHDGFALRSLAHIAEQRGDTQEAATRWRIAQSRAPDTNEGYHGCIRCLVALGRFDEAETELNRGRRHDPYDLEFLYGLARLSDRRQDWAQSLSRWKFLAEKHDNPPSYAWAAVAMVQLGDLEGAEVWLAEPSRRFSSNIEIAVEYAVVAHRRGDLTAACKRWATVRAIDPYAVRAYHEEVRCLVEAGRHADADELLRGAIERFPGEPWPRLIFAHLAHQRQDWDEAILRWDAFRERFPTEEAGYSKGAEALNAAGRGEAAAALLNRS